MGEKGGASFFRPRGLKTFPTMALRAFLATESASSLLLAVSSLCQAIGQEIRLELVSLFNVVK